MITEALLREQLRAETPETFYIPEGKILSPAAREYLQQRKIKISKDPPPAPAVPEEPKTVVTEAPVQPVAKYVDEETGAFYTEKPEHMTHLYGNVLIPKAHPHIFFLPVQMSNFFSRIFDRTEFYLQKNYWSASIFHFLPARIVVHIAKNWLPTFSNLPT